MSPQGWKMVWFAASVICVLLSQIEMFAGAHGFLIFASGTAAGAAGIRRPGDNSGPVELR